MEDQTNRHKMILILKPLLASISLPK